MSEKQLESSKIVNYGKFTLALCKTSLTLATLQ